MIVVVGMLWATFSYVSETRFQLSEFGDPNDADELKVAGEGLALFQRPRDNVLAQDG